MTVKYIECSSRKNSRYVHNRQ